MEKLQPVIKHAFWICFSFAMLLIVFGWWKASGELQASITENTGKVDAALRDAKVGSTANPRWTEKATEVNDSDQKEYEQSASKLWEEQKKARTFPSSIEQQLRKFPYGSEITYDPLRGAYGRRYRDYFLEQLEVIQPFRAEEAKGLVQVNLASITSEDDTRWNTKRPTSAEIWKAQEDIWLLRSLFDSIADVNAGAEVITDAPLRALLTLQLRGGDRDAAGAAAGGAGMGFGGGGETMGYEMGAEMGGFGGRGGGPGGGANQPWKQFVGASSGDILVEEFGAVAGMGGRGAGYGSGFGGMMNSAGPMSSYEGGGGEGGGAGAGPAEEDRYVDDEEDLPYRTRAFYMHVKIHQDYIPTLLVELTKSSFPVEIVRVDVRFGQGKSQQGGMGMSSMGGMGYGGPGESYSSGPGGYEGGGMSSMQYGGGLGAGGLGGGGLGGGGLGAGGLGSSGLGGGGLGGRGLGGGGARDLLSKGRPVNSLKASQGAHLLASAMADGQLADVRIGGLMTLYRSPEENDAAAATEAAAEEEDRNSSMVPIDEELEAVPESATPETEAPGDASEMNEAAPEGAASETPADADPVAPAAADPGADPASGAAVPADSAAPAADSASESPAPDAAGEENTTGTN